MSMDGPHLPRPTTLRRIAAPGGLAVAAALFLGGTIFALKTPAAEYFIAGTLRDAGLKNVHLTVTQVGFGGITVQNLEAEGGALQVARIDARFTLPGLARARFESVAIEKLAATLTWDNAGLKLGSFQPDPNSGPLQLPYIGEFRANDMLLRVVTPGATYSAPLSVTATPVANGWDARATGTLQGPGVGIGLNWTGVITPADPAQSSGSGRFDIAVDDFNIPGTADHLDAHGLVTLEAGEGVFTMRVAQPLTFSTTLSPRADQSTLLQGLGDLPWSVTIAPSASDAALVITAAGERRAARFDIAANGAAGAGRMTFALVGEAARTPQATEFRLDNASAELQRIPFGGGAVSGRVAVTNFGGTPRAAEGKISAALDMAGVKIEGVKLEDARAVMASTMRVADGALTFDFETLRLLFTRGGVEGWTLEKPAELTLAKNTNSPQNFRLGPLGSGANADLAFTLPEVALQSDAETESHIIFHAPNVRLNAGTKLLSLAARLQATDVSLNHPSAEARDGRFDVKLDGTALSGTVSARFVRVGARTTDGSKGALVTNATLATRGDRYSVRGTFSTAAGAKIGDYTADLSSDLARGAATFAMPKIRFERGGKFDTADLAFITPVNDLTGTIGLDAKASWSPTRSTQTATATLDDVSFAAGDISVVGLTTSVELAELSPPRSVGTHKVTVESIIAGLPLTDLSADYVLAGDGTAVVRQGAVNVAGGQITLTDAVLPFNGGDGAFALGVQKLDMSLLATQAAIDGLSVTGTLSGSVPLRSDKTGYHFAEGLLRSDGPGQLIYKSSAPSPALSENQGGALLLQALSNFTYDRLSLTLNGPLAEEINLLVGLAGKNPDLYGGYPIEFNLSLTGRLTQILRQGVVGYGIPADLERRLREGKPPAP